MKFSFKSVWKNECPRCRQAKIYKEPLQLSKPFNMYEKCPVCGLNMEPEPGFYFGAMFLSYILSAWFFLLPTLFFVFYLGWSAEAAMGATIAIAAITYLKFLRGSRSLWLHINVPYNAEIANKVSSQSIKNG